MELTTTARTGLGILTGIVGLIAMIRLITGAGFTTAFAWIFVLLAMLPWIAYCAWRGWHGRLRPTAAFGVVGLCVAGLVVVWLFTIGPVLALACSLAAFLIIWIHDWPPRRPKGEDQFVRVEELTAEEPRNAA
jgi:uncharacterized membrane protein YhaH (DUF805 family)